MGGCYCWLLLLVIIAGHYCWSLLLVVIAGHFCWSLLLVRFLVGAGSCKGVQAGRGTTGVDSLQQQS